jgi:hypothetical protein
VHGPVIGGRGISQPQPNAPLPAGFVEEEWIIGGEASSYELTSDASADGFWDAHAGKRAPYATRMIVRRPGDPDAFSGVVLIEWLNATAGTDSSPDWGFLAPEIGRSGHAWVGVTAQAIGVDGGTGLLSGDPNGGLAASDPERYGTLSHPGDAYGYDIFTQTGVALSETGPTSPLGDLEPTHFIGIGESQSAFFLTTYVNAVHQVSGFFDGFLVHSRGGGAAPLAGQFGSEDIPGAVRIRTDLADPVLIFETETDMTVLKYAGARQDDTDTVRTWEVAGTAHADAGVIAAVTGGVRDPSSGSFLGCTTPINAGPQPEVVRAALRQLVTWTVDGIAPPTSPRLHMTQDGVAIVRDRLGNAVGGIRTPLVDAPVDVLIGDPAQGASDTCALFGQTIALDATTLTELHGSRERWLDAFRASAANTVAAGFMLNVDADALIEEVEARELPFES